MEILNQTPFQFALIPGRLLFPGHSLTLIVKGTFCLSPNQIVTPDEEQLFPTGDEFYEDDEEMISGARYASDFAHFKPRADLLLAGNCYAPKGKKVLAHQVAFQVGPRSKSLKVFGERYWKRGLLGSNVTDPEPFAGKELRYENSFGGEGYKKNPVGKGYGKLENEVGKKVRLLPNILNVDDTIDSPGSRPEPAGFGPFGRMWQQRQSKLGTYKGNYLKERWPWFATDFDWGYFNAAPPDMQVEGYLKGDEKLYFENLHPEHQHYKSKLPGLRVRCFVNKQINSEHAPVEFDEVAMKLDTLWVDMEAEQLVLVWRGWTAVQSEDFEEVEHVFIVSEAVAEEAKSVEHYKDLFQMRLAEEEEKIVEEEPESVEEGAASEPELNEELVKSEERMRNHMIEAGLDPDNPPEPTPEQKAQEERILKELGFEEVPEEHPMTRKRFQERLSQGENFEDEDLSGLDLSELDMGGVLLHGTLLAGAILSNSDLSGADLTGANLAEVDLSGAKLKKACLKEADLTGAKLVGTDLTDAVLNDAVFEKAIMGGAILNEVTAINADFCETDLAGASIRESNLTGADFSNSNLEKADFARSKLCEASVEGAKGVQVNMAETDLTELRASEGCDFSRGCFRKATGTESIWEKANLTGADFCFSRMEGADFSSACLEHANLTAADMKSARFSKADLKEAKLVEMNLFEGSLEKADLTRTDLRGSNLYGVEFLDAHLEETKLEYANIKMTKLAPK